jgi:hypothetical protein
MQVPVQIESRARHGARTRVLVALVLFGIGFGYVEAAVVVYLRALYEPMRQRLTPGQPAGALFPLIRLDQLEAEGPDHVRRLVTELGREAATLVMLAAVALAVARNVRQWLAAFVTMFGIWDVFYYVFLKLILDWPPSLLTWDILFLLPVPWVGPVLAPILVSITMIGCGVVAMWREMGGRPIRTRWFHWVGLLGGGLIIVLAFCWDFPNTAGGGLPNPFNWPLFAVGEIIGLVTSVHMLRGREAAPP